jgi:hypothetical protein
MISNIHTAVRQKHRNPGIFDLDAFRVGVSRATHLTRGDMSIPRSRLALKAKIRKDFAFKIEIRNLRKARRREGMGVDGLPLVVGDKGGGGTGLRLRIGGT